MQTRLFVSHARRVSSFPAGGVHHNVASGPASPANRGVQRSRRDNPQDSRWMPLRRASRGQGPVQCTMPVELRLEIPLACSLRHRYGSGAARRRVDRYRPRSTSFVENLSSALVYWSTQSSIDILKASGCTPAREPMAVVQPGWHQCSVNFEFSGGSTRQSAKTRVLANATTAVVQAEWQ